MKRFVLSLIASLASVGCSGAPPSEASLKSDSAGQISCTWCNSAIPLTDAPSDYDPLLASIGDARVVALGEDTHGTHEFYRERARITERLMREKHFGALIIEGDWPDTERVNHYVRGLGNDRSAAQALSAFQDFPAWMWRNAEFANLVERLRTYNQALPEAERVGVYGMDIYNFFGAMRAVRTYAEKRDPKLAHKVQEQYRCFSRYNGNPEVYGEATRNRSRSCETQARAVDDLLAALPKPRAGPAREELFAASRSAASVVAAEEYYRTSFSGANSWNVRDRAMVRNIDDIARHMGAGSTAPGKVVVWAHNSHVGDARATDMRLRGDVNVGQLLRESIGADAYLVGMLTRGGTVIAATDWGSPGRVQELRSALPESYSGLFHSAGVGNALFRLRELRDAKRRPMPLLQRAVGVIYRPNSERLSHYFKADIVQQFDAVVFIDQTQALEPLR
jgi:erythromycin esterase-like protein